MTSTVVGRYRGKKIWEVKLPPSLDDDVLDETVLFLTTAVVHSKVKGLIRRSGQFPTDDHIKVDVEHAP